MFKKLVLFLKYETVCKGGNVNKVRRPSEIECGCFVFLLQGCGY
jgi:hypothetical protein